MKWTIRYLREAEEDLNRLDGSVSREVRKAIEKLKTDPENFGKALGHKQVNLTGLREVKLRKAGIRIVYNVCRTESSLLIVVVGFRADDEVYKIADRRMKDLK
ncbi:MAG: type II toxin-antitoxin system RelE/ParE family toxin [Oscillibacter sp.]|nr:type II toxin-antitoxin system RelE/ParE family toxin [Oscillibacter sp.]